MEGLQTKRAKTGKELNDEEMCERLLGKEKVGEVCERIREVCNSG